MPTMPSVTGQNYWEALQTLETAGVYVPASLGYFGANPITVAWASTGAPAGGVIAQSPLPAVAVAANGPVTLTVIEFAVAAVIG